MRILRAAYANRWVRYCLTIALLGILAARVDPHRLLSALQSARGDRVLLALLLTAPFLYLKALRWHVLLRAGGVDATFGEAVRSLVGGMGLALLTPARLGELIRVAYIRDPRKWKIGGLVLLDKGFDVLVLAGLSTAGAWVLVGVWAGACLLVVTVVGLAVVYFPGRLLRTLMLASQGLPLRAKLLSAASSMESLGPGSTTTFLLLTCAAFAVVLMQFGLILSSWHTASIEIVGLTFPLVILTNVLPLTVGGLGIREGASAVLLAHYGVPTADAALAAFLMFVLNTALPGVVGAFLLPISPQVQASGPSPVANRR